MSSIKLFNYQKEILEKTKDQNKVAYWLDMGLGKTFIGSEKLIELNTKYNLVICQKSKIDDWYHHFCEFYGVGNVIFNLTNKKEFDQFMNFPKCDQNLIGIINYDLVFRRKDLLKLKDFTLLLDESSQIQNVKAKRTKFILKLKSKNNILLSGTPVSGKYENLWSQAQLLGWNINKSTYEKQYIKFKNILVEGLPIRIVDGYKNVDRLKQKLRENGAIFLKTEEVLELPEQNFIEVNCKKPKEYYKFLKNKIVEINDQTLVGSRILTHRLYLRMICGLYNKYKYEALEDILESTNERIIVFYNFKEELSQMLKRCSREHVSIINGDTKDLSAYENHDDSVTFIQYQAGAMGLNLQKANKIIYFSPTESSELFEQSKKRIHRIGQNDTCFYYLLTAENSIENAIYKNLKLRRDYTNELFKEEILNGQIN